MKKKLLRTKLNLEQLLPQHSMYSLNKISCPSSRPSQSLQPFQKVYLRFKHPSPNLAKSQITHKRHNKLFKQSHLTPYHLNSLKDSLNKINTKTTSNKWRSPLENKQRSGQFNRGDRLLRGNELFEKDQIVFDGDVSEINVGNQNQTIGYGQSINLNIPTHSKPSTSKLSNPRLLGKTGLQKLTKQFQALSKQCLKSNKLAILPIESPHFISHFQKYYESQISSPEDQILQKFKATNPHYKTTLRRNNPELVRRIFQSLSNYSPFDIYSYIRYHVIFVTHESNNTEKAYFLCNVFYEKEESVVTVEEFRRVLEMVCGGGGGERDKVEKSVEGILRLVVGERGEKEREDGDQKEEEEDNQNEKENIVSKNVVFRKLEMYDDVAEVMISLLCKK